MEQVCAKLCAIGYSNELPADFRESAFSGFSESVQYQHFLDDVSTKEK
jgi:hypothetical protein